MNLPIANSSSKVCDEHRRSLSDAILNQTHDAIVVTDCEANIVYVNAAFTKLTQYESNEVLGKNPSILKSGSHDEDFYRVMWRKMQEPQGWQGELWNRKKDGSLFFEAQTIRPLRDNNGDISHFISTFHDKTYQIDYRENLKNLAYVDPLTGFDNRIMFKRRFDAEFKEAVAHRTEIIVFGIELKSVEKLIKVFGSAVAEEVFKDLVVRLQGVESLSNLARTHDYRIAAVSYSSSQEDSIQKTIETIFRVIESPIIVRGQTLSVSPLVGYTIAPTHAVKSLQVLHNLDITLLEARENNIDHMAFSPCLLQQKTAEFDLYQEIKQALETEQFEMFYQPQFCCTEGKLVGAEALIRWKKGETWVSPGSFLSVAKEFGLMGEVNQYVLVRTMNDVSKIGKECQNSVRIALNLCNPMPTVVDVEQQISIQDISSSQLEIEVTEDMIMGDFESTKLFLMKLKNAGIKVSIDDFGTGHSSLARLNELPFDKLKIDRSFIQDLNSESSKTLVSAIISLSHSLNKTVVAEGVETEEQLQLLKTMGCDVFQGFYAAKPMPLNSFIELLNTYPLQTTSACTDSDHD